MPDDAHVDAFLLPEQIGFWLGGAPRCCWKCLSALLGKRFADLIVHSKTCQTDRRSDVRTSNSKGSLCSNFCFDLWTLRTPKSQNPVATAHLWQAQLATCASKWWLIRRTSLIQPSCQTALCCGCTAHIVYSSVDYCKYCLLINCSLCFSHTWYSHVSLQEMVENMDSTRDVWAMQLDTIRNRIIRVELLVAVASFSLMVSTVPASFFGMNLTSGLEVMPFHILLFHSQ